MITLIISILDASIKDFKPTDLYGETFALDVFIIISLATHYN